MPEITPYFEAITAERALLLTEEEALKGETLISVEAQPEFDQTTTGVFVREHFPLFLTLIQKLSPSDQDILLSYFVLNRSQTSLSYIFEDAQTRIGSTIRLAMKRLCFYILFGEVTAEKLSPILSRAGLEWPEYRQAGTRSRSSVQVPFSRVIETFDRCRNFNDTADELGLHRPDVRRTMSKAATALLDSEQPQEQAIGAYLYGVTHRVDLDTATTKVGAPVIERRDADLLGKFRINVGQKGVTDLFVAKADV